MAETVQPARTLGLQAHQHPGGFQWPGVDLHRHEEPGERLPDRLPLRLPWHLHRLEAAEHQVPLVAPGSPLLPPHFVLRRGQEVRHEETSSWQLGGERETYY